MWEKLKLKTSHQLHTIDRFYGFTMKAAILCTELSYGLFIEPTCETEIYVYIYDEFGPVS